MEIPPYQMKRKAILIALVFYIIRIMKMVVVQKVCWNFVICTDKHSLNVNFANVFIEQSVIGSNSIENEKQVWEEVCESLNKRIVELSEKNVELENQLKQHDLMYSDVVAANETLQKEKDDALADYLKEKKAKEGQIEQILRLNEEVIHSVEEKEGKQKEIENLQKVIEKLNEEIQKLQDGLDDPDNYYKMELGNVIDEKATTDELYNLKCNELHQLKEILSSKLASTK